MSDDNKTPDNENQKPEPSENSIIEESPQNPPKIEKDKLIIKSLRNQLKQKDKAIDSLKSQWQAQEETIKDLKTSMKLLQELFTAIERGKPTLKTLANTLIEPLKIESKTINSVELDKKTSEIPLEKQIELLISELIEFNNLIKQKHTNNSNSSNENWRIANKQKINKNARPTTNVNNPRPHTADTKLPNKHEININYPPQFISENLWSLLSEKDPVNTCKVINPTKYSTTIIRSKPRFTRRHVLKPRVKSRENFRRVGNHRSKFSQSQNRNPFSCIPAKLIYEHQTNDKRCLMLINKIKNKEIIDNNWILDNNNNLLMKKTSLGKTNFYTFRTVIPQTLIKDILILHHRNTCGGKFSLDKTILKIKKYFTWETIFTDIKDYIYNCNNCKNFPTITKRVGPSNHNNTRDMKKDTFIKQAPVKKREDSANRKIERGENIEVPTQDSEILQNIFEPPTFTYPPYPNFDEEDEGLDEEDREAREMGGMTKMEIIDFEEYLKTLYNKEPVIDNEYIAYPDFSKTVGSDEEEAPSNDEAESETGKNNYFLRSRNQIKH